MCKSLAVDEMTSVGGADRSCRFVDAHPFSIDVTANLLKRGESKTLKGVGFAAQGLPDV